MKYLNLPANISHDEMVLKSTHEQIGVWLLLLCYCHQQMNNGMIQGCHEWSDAMWMRIAGVNADTLRTESPLWHFSAMALIVHHYDSRAEDAYRKKQRMGAVYVERRWQAEREKKIVKLPSSNSRTSQKNNAS